MVITKKAQKIFYIVFYKQIHNKFWFFDNNYAVGAQ